MKEIKEIYMSNKHEHGIAFMKRENINGWLQFSLMLHNDKGRE